MKSELLMNPRTRLLVNNFIERPAHSLGLSGPKGAGKLRIAKYICKNTLQLDDKELAFKVEIIDAEDQNGIDDIRSLKKSLSTKSIGDKNFERAVVFNNFNKSSSPAQNSILKLLEEPPEDTIIIILVDQKNNILPTIKSRLQWIDVLPLSLTDLKSAYPTISDSQLLQAHHLSGGYAEEFEDSLSGDESLLKLAVDDAKKILKLKKPARLAAINDIVGQDKYSQEEFLTALLKIYVALARREVAQKGQVQKQMIYKIEYILKTKESLKYNPNAKLVFTDLFYAI